MTTQTRTHAKTDPGKNSEQKRGANKMASFCEVWERKTRGKW